MLFHIKPTADKDQVFRFYSNFIRYFRNFDKKETEPLQDALRDGIEPSGDGVIESIINLKNAVDLIRKKHTKACLQEIKELLRLAAKELNIPIS